MIVDRTRAVIIAIIVSGVVAAAVVIFFAFSDNLRLPGTPIVPPPTSLDDTGGDGSNDTFSVLPDSNPPKLKDPNLRVEKLLSGLAKPTSMAFLDHDDILILQKDNGLVRRVSNGTLEPQPLLAISVSSINERGLLGIAATNPQDFNGRTVFLYFTEQEPGVEVKNRVYRYDLSGDGLIGNGTLILDLPATPGPNHDGGKLAIGPDGLLYAVIGDLNRNGMLQNFKAGPEPDSTSVILRVDRDGKAATDNVLSDASAVINASLQNYYAYGIRNSFGIDFDPLTGVLWDTENGPAGYDEINVVRPGFNSGWEQVMGPAERAGIDASDLVQFEHSRYADPVFSWRHGEGITDIAFLKSFKLGDRYASNIFVGDINNGNLYLFTVNEARDAISFEKNHNAGLSDLVADSVKEVEEITFGTGFGGITDLETGPDGYLYVLSFNGSLYRVVPEVKDTS